MRIYTIETGQQVEMINIDHLVKHYLEEEQLVKGVLLLFVPHTTAGITINENGDPDVQRDIMMMINQVIPFDGGYHHFEGNSAAHIKSTLFGCQTQLIIADGLAQLGTWQSVYFCEFDGPRQRNLWIEHHSTSGHAAASLPETPR